MNSVTETLTALARATLPAGRHLACGGAHTASTAWSTLEALPPALRNGYRALLTMADWRCRLRTGRPIHKLAPEQLLALVNRWRQGPLAERSALRVLLAPLKAAHFADRELFRALGCTFDFDERAPEVVARVESERCHDAAALGDDLDIDCDVVVIGTGAGGAVAAATLAEAGLAVALVEEGHYFRRHDFTGRPFAMQRLLYRDAGATIALGNAAIPVPIGKTVGGTTTINSGTCYRVPERVLARWRRDFGLDEMTHEALAPYFEEVESVLGVAAAAPQYLGGVARVIARGCERLGIREHGPLARNAPSCDGQGLCCFGCPTDAKRSTNVSYVPKALRAGAELFYGARAHEILVDRGRAVGIRAQTPSGHRIEIRARAVIVACGALMTPLLLAENGLCQSSGQLGANLTIHPAQGVMARFAERIASYAAIPQGYAIEALHDDGILFEGAATPLDLSMVALPLVGAELVDLAESFDKLAIFGFMIEDKCTGRVRGVGRRPVITYRLGAREIELLRRGVDVLARIYFAAGAESVYPMVHGFDRLDSPADLARLRSARLRASDFELTAYHPLGTARMGRDPRRSVVDPRCQAHDVPGLYVMDGSCLPTSPAVNPQVTIMALATRAARQLAEALS